MIPLLTGATVIRSRRVLRLPWSIESRKITGPIPKSRNENAILWNLMRMAGCPKALQEAEICTHKTYDLRGRNGHQFFPEKFITYVLGRSLSDVAPLQAYPQ